MGVTVVVAVQLGPVQLNEEQQRAVSAMCTVAGGLKPLALFGPPGTGKTVRPPPLPQ